MPTPIVSVDQEAIKEDLRELVGRTVEGTLNGLLEEGADDLVGADRHGRTARRGACRAGHCDRSLTAAGGNVALRMPKPKGVRFAAATIERCRRREASVAGAMAEMCPAGVPTGRTEDASEALWGASVSAAAVSDLSERALASVEERRNRPPGRACPHACVDGVCLRRARGGACENAAAMVATGVSDGGCREAIGAAEGFAESSECRRGFPSRLRSRGLRGVRMLTGDKAAGTVGSVAEAFPEAACRRCAVRFHRNVLAKAPKSGRAKAAAMPKAAHAMEPREAGGAKAPEAAAGLEGMRLGEAAKAAREGCAETPTYARFPPEHWRRIRTNNAIERLNGEIRRRTRVVGAFPDGKGALMLVTARLKYVAESEWGSRRHLDVTLLDE